jgi:hypothetical protein
MAVRLLDEWLGVTHGDAQFTHTAIDDLESFLWILFWVPLEVHHIKFHTKRHPESLWREILNSPVLKEQAAKGDLVQKLTVAIRTKTALGYIRLFYGLIGEWYDIAFEGMIEVGQMLQEDPTKLDLDFHKKYYQRYLDAGFKYLGSLPDTWDVKEPGNK